MKGLLLDFWSEFDFLFKNFTTFFTNDAGGTGAPGWKLIVMWVVGIVLIYLAIKKEMEPALLLPMGFGAILVNIPFSGAIGESGIIESLFRVGIEASEAMPLILFIGIGAMIDFGPLIANPKLMFFGAAAQFGIFLTIILASFFPQFSFADAAAIGIIGAADGPTSILVEKYSEIQLFRGDNGRGVFIYGVSPDNTALCHKDGDHKKGTCDQDGI